MVLVDSNVVVDVLERDPQWFAWSVGQMRNLSMTQPLVINAIVYAELAATFTSSAILDQKIATMKLIFEEIPPPSRFPGRKGLSAVSPPRRNEGQRPPRLLYWRARSRALLSAANQGHPPIRNPIPERSPHLPLTHFC